MKPALETSRLVLHEMSMADLDFVAAMLAHPEVMRYFPRCYTRDEAADWIHRQEARYARHGHGYWLALDKATGQPVGQAGLLLQEVDGIEEPGLGYIIDRPFWRRRFATEAATAIPDYAFDTLGKPRLITLIRPENEPSQRVALEIGMKLEKRTMFAGFEHLLFSMSRTGREAQAATLQRTQRQNV